MKAPEEEKKIRKAIADMLPDEETQEEKDILEAFENGYRDAINDYGWKGAGENVSDKIAKSYLDGYTQAKNYKQRILD